MYLGLSWERIVLIADQAKPVSHIRHRPLLRNFLLSRCDEKRRRREKNTSERRHETLYVTTILQDSRKHSRFPHAVNHNGHTDSYRPRHGHCHQ